ncbi:hypothetical protein VTK56DRAFT_2891 [Thermocarpiscus australiensis]
MLPASVIASEPCLATSERRGLSTIAMDTCLKYGYSPVFIFGCCPGGCDGMQSDVGSTPIVPLITERVDKAAPLLISPAPCSVSVSLLPRGYRYVSSCYRSNIASGVSFGGRWWNRICPRTGTVRKAKRRYCNILQYLIRPEYKYILSPASITH